MKNNWTEIIADKINSGVPIILCSAAGDTLNILRSLKLKFDLLPTAIVDNDKSKQNKTFRGFYNLKISSPRKALMENPDAEFFISTLDYKYEIIGELTSKYNIAAEKIINYEPVVKKRSCAYIEKSLICDEKRSLSYCWYQPKELPTIPFTGDYINSIDDFVSLRESAIDSFSKSEKTVCGDCCFLRENYYPADRKIRWINYGVGGVCNFNCIYCGSNAKTARFIDKDTPLLPRVIETLESKKLLADDYGINIAPGEPTIHPLKESLFSEMNCYSNVINTNLAVFNQQLYNITAENYTKLVVSIDSGTRESFKNIKGADLFGKVLQNLKIYSSAGSGIIVLKYVFIPGVNDTEADADGFAEICDQCGCLIGNISYDYNSPKPIPKKTAKVMKRLKNNLYERDIMCTQNIVYSSSDYVKALIDAMK